MEPSQKNIIFLKLNEYPMTFSLQIYIFLCDNGHKLFEIWIQPIIIQDSPQNLTYAEVSRLVSNGQIFSKTEKKFFFKMSMFSTFLAYFNRMNHQLFQNPRNFK